MAGASRQTGVYPRECGGTLPSRPRPRPGRGLSPRVRGNPLAEAPELRPPGSIPASAGEPGGQQCRFLRMRVYPRECGGTHPRLADTPLPYGLSPRVRGNPRPGWRRHLRLRSIPASAGEPIPLKTRIYARRVYPRECGGTRKRAFTESPRRGLSPRVRGNRASESESASPMRSIPASAGEPDTGRAHENGARVYPRECGGTVNDPCQRGVDGGLSPRVRGNRDDTQDHRRVHGSIPASAGEPITSCLSRTAGRVYPRECGGTTVTQGRRAGEAGLSPRVRGNLAADPPRSGRIRSIPASAGEPSRGG